MKKFQSHLKIITAFSAVLFMSLLPRPGSEGVEAGQQAPSQPATSSRDAWMTLNNLGISELEQFRFAKAAENFEKARSLSPDFFPAQVNQGIALYYDRKNAEAEKLLRAVIAHEPGQSESLFILGLLDRSAGNDEEALGMMKSVLKNDPLDPATLYFAGSLESALHRYDEAIAHFRAGLARDPVNVSLMYALAKTLVQKGDSEEAEKAMAQFQDWKSRGTGTSFGNQYGEQGQYAQALRASGPGGVADKNSLSPLPRFVDAAAQAGIECIHSGPRGISLFGEPGAKTPASLEALGSGAAFLDYDKDSWPDLILAGHAVQGRTKPAIFRNNRNGTFTPITDSGLDRPEKGTGIAVGDYDNDGNPDLFIAGLRGSALYHSEGGRFKDMTGLLGVKPAEIDAISAAFADLDHDGDLDLLVTTAGQGPLFYRNNGDGTFTETGAKAGIAGTAFQTSAAILDFNDSRDTDFILAGSELRLFSNRRDGTFADVAPKMKLGAPNGTLGLTSGDFDGDGKMDLFFPNGSGAGPAMFYWNDGDAYGRREIPLPSGTRFHSARAFDWDNDGDLDILLVGDSLRLLENKGHRTFVDVTAAAGLGHLEAKGARAVAVADYDRDGDSDLLVTRCGYAPLLLRNDGGNRNHTFRLSLEGKTDNRQGLGAKIDWAAAGLWCHREVDGSLGFLTQSSTDLLLGLGNRKAPDFVRVLWPTGVLQSEIPAQGSSELTLAELDRKGTSCPILYTWNGQKFDFVSDFLGGCALGYLEEPGRYGVPDTDEYVKIRHNQLAPRGGRLSIRMANQLEEVILFDMVRLLAVDHPEGVEIYPNERLFSAPPYPEFHIHTASGSIPVKSALDGKGIDWTAALVTSDRDFVRGFRLLPYKGYAEEHTLELDLGDTRNAPRILLLLDGWIDYATSSSNFAAAQAGLRLMPPRLEAWDGAVWRTVLEEMGFPAGLPKIIPIDLTGKIPKVQKCRIRIVTNMRIYWDMASVVASPEDTRLKVTTLEPVLAKAKWLGYPKETSPDGRVPFGYDFAAREAIAPWKTHRGLFTPLGDVLNLLKSADDRYVTLAHGEVIAADFSERDLPALPSGWTRDWLLHVDGFGKDMDIHSEHADTLEPLPRHKELPYRSDYWRLPKEMEWNAFRRQYMKRKP
jgi:tetratricopeptide (TPR) repeat protein